jgi:hypothetical protein
MTPKKFSNLVAKTLGIKYGPAVARETITRAVIHNNPYIHDEQDGSFLVRNLPDWQAVALVKAGFTATIKVAPKSWYTETERVGTYWSAPAK